MSSWRVQTMLIGTLHRNVPTFLEMLFKFPNLFSTARNEQSPYLQDKIQCFNMVAILNMLNTTLDSSFSSLRRSLFIKLRRRERMCSPCFSAFTKHLGRILRNKWRGPVKKRRKILCEFFGKWNVYITFVYLEVIFSLSYRVMFSVYRYNQKLKSLICDVWTIHL